MKKQKTPLIELLFEIVFVLARGVHDKFGEFLLYLHLWAHFDANAAFDEDSINRDFYSILDVGLF